MNSTSWYNPLKIKFIYEINTGLRDLSNIPRKEDFDEIKQEVKNVIEDVSYIRSEQKYLKGRESKFRSITENSMSGIFWWGVIQIMVIIIILIKQYYYLKNLILKAKIL